MFQWFLLLVVGSVTPPCLGLSPVWVPKKLKKPSRFTSHLVKPRPDFGWYVVCGWGFPKKAGDIAGKKRVHWRGWTTPSYMELWGPYKWPCKWVTGLFHPYKWSCFTIPKTGKGPSCNPVSANNQQKCKVLFINQIQNQTRICLSHFGKIPPLL